MSSRQNQWWKFLCNSALFIGILGLPSSALTAPTYRMTDLGALAGTEHSIALGLNDLGQVVGFSGTKPFLWSNGEMTELGVLPGIWGSQATSINNAGIVAGTSGGLPAMWASASTSATSLSPGGTTGWARAISDSGLIVGSIASSGSRGALWDESGLTILGIGDVWAVDNVGGFAGELLLSGAMHAFYYEIGAGVLHDLGAPNGGPFGGSSRAYGMNDLGQVVGTIGSGFTHPVLWKAGSMIDLTPTWGYGGTAYDTNNRGEIVGTIATFGGSVPTLWSDEGEASDLNSLMDPLDPLFGTVRIVAAQAVNERGQIAAWGNLRGYVDARAFLLTPVLGVEIPAPKTILLVAFGLAALLLCRVHSALAFKENSIEFGRGKSQWPTRSVPSAEVRYALEKRARLR